MLHRFGRESHVASADVYRGGINPLNDSLFYTGKLQVKYNGANLVLEQGLQVHPFNPNLMAGFAKTSEAGCPGCLLRSSGQGDLWNLGTRGDAANVGGGTTPITDPVAQVWTAMPMTGTTLSATPSTNSGSYEGPFKFSEALRNVAFLGDQSGKKVYISNNIEDVNVVWNLLPNAPQSTNYRFATHPYQPKTVFLATAAQIYMSLDLGQTWTQMGQFPTVVGGIQKIVVDRNKVQGVYVQTGNTIYYKDESLKNWLEFNRGLPNSIQDMEIQYNADGDDRLYVSRGGGVWMSPLYDASSRNKPVADFGLWNGANSLLYTGDTLRLNDLSKGRVFSRVWNVDGGVNTHLATSDLKEPTFILTEPGYYNVSLKVKNEYDSAVKVRNQWIQVLSKQIPFASCRASAGTGVWYKGLTSVALDQQVFPSGSSTEGFYVDYSGSRVFKTTAGVHNLELKSAYAGYTYSWSMWLDSNNNGSFESNELIQKDTTKTLNQVLAQVNLPSVRLKNQVLRMRILFDEVKKTLNPCENMVAGQVEDYGLVITDIPPSLTVQTLTQAAQSARITVQTDLLSGVNELGLVYAPILLNPNLNNSPSQVAKLQLKDTLELTDLIPGQNYHLRAYAKTNSGVYYSNDLSVNLNTWEMPTLFLADVATPYGDTAWQLSAKLSAGTNGIQSLVLEYGINNWSSFLSLDTAGMGQSGGISKAVILPWLKLNSIYQARLKVTTVDQKVFYSNPAKVSTYEDQLLAYWDMEGIKADTLFDKSGNNRHGTISKASVIAGLQGNALLLKDSSLITLGLGNFSPPWTIDFWTRKDANSTATYSGFFGTSNSSPTVHLDIEQSSSNRALCYSQVVSGYGCKHVLAQGIWKRITYQGTPDSVVKIFVDKVLVDSLRTTVAPLLPLRTMGYHTSNLRSMYGAMDEVKVYSKKATLDSIWRSSQTLTWTPPATLEVGQSLNLDAMASSGQLVDYRFLLGDQLVEKVGAQLLAKTAGLVKMVAVQIGNASYKPVWFEYALTITDPYQPSSSSVLSSAVVSSSSVLSSSAVVSSSSVLSSSVVVSSSSVLSSSVVVSSSSVLSSSVVVSSSSVLSSSVVVSSSSVLSSSVVVSSSSVLSSSVVVSSSSTQSSSSVKMDQSISFSPLGDFYLGDPAFTVSASASSNLAVSFASLSQSICSLSGNVVSFLGAGICQIQASQLGDINYNPAPNVQQSFNVLMTVQSSSSVQLSSSTTLSSSSILSSSVLSSSVLMSSSQQLSSSSLLVSSSELLSSSSFNLSSSIVLTSSSSGLSSSVLSSSAVLSSSSNTSSSSVPQDQIISFNALGSVVFGASPVSLSATASSNLAVSFASLSQSICSLSGNMVSFLGAGICQIQATQSGDVNYNPAPLVVQNLSVLKADQNIIWSAIADQTVGQMVTLLGQSTSGLEIQYQTLSPDICQVQQNSVSVVVEGRCLVRASQSGDQNYNPAVEVQREFNVLASSSSVVSSSSSISSSSSDLTKVLSQNLSFQQKGLNLEFYANARGEMSYKVFNSNGQILRQNDLRFDANGTARLSLDPSWKNQKVWIELSATNQSMRIEINQLKVK